MQLGENSYAALPAAMRKVSDASTSNDRTFGAAVSKVLDGAGNFRKYVAVIFLGVFLRFPKRKPDPEIWVGGAEEQHFIHESILLF